MNKTVSLKKEIAFKTMISKITSISLEHVLTLGAENIISGDFIVSGTYKMTEASQIDEDFSYKVPVEITIDDRYSTDDIVFDIDDFVYEIVDGEKLCMSIDLCIDNLELKEESPSVEEFNSVEEKVDVLEELDDVLRDIEELAIEPEETDDFINDLDEVRDEDLFLETSKEIELEIPAVEDDYVEEVEEKDVKKENNLIEVNTHIEEEYEKKADVASIFSAFASTEETFSTYSIYIIREGDSVESVMDKYNVTRDILKDYNDLSSIKIGSKIIIPSVVNE